MPYVFNPFTGNLDYTAPAGGGAVSVPELATDPTTPTPGDTWVLRTVNNPANTLQGLIGGVPLTTAAADYKYQLSYATADEGTKRVELT